MDGQIDGHITANIHSHTIVIYTWKEDVQYQY